MNSQRYKDILDRFNNVKILVVGDVMLDEFLIGKVERISPEAPVPIVNIQKKHLLPGGAANVARNIRTLGGEVYLLGVVGEDNNANRFKETLSNADISSDYLVVEPQRPTTIKTRIIAGSQQIVRTDIEQVEPLRYETRQKISDALDSIDNSYDAVIISDYDKGVINKELLKRIVSKANEQHIPISVDPNVTHFFDYTNVTILTPNLKELEDATHKRLRDPETLRQCGLEVIEKLFSGGLLVTQGEEGMTLFEMHGNITHIPTVAKQVYDVTGAGDTVIGTLSMALAAGASFLESAKLSNVAAGIVVGKRGTATVSRAELQSVLDEQENEE